MKKIKFVAAVVAVLLLLSGCQRMDGISKMSIAQGVAIDKKRNEIMLSVEYLDLSKGTGTTDTLGDDITSVVSAVGDNISLAVSRASSSFSGPIYFGQNRIIVLGENYCKYDLKNGVDYILRGVDSRVDVSIAMSENDAENIMKINQNKSKVPAQSLYETIKSGEKNAMSICVCANDLLNISSTKTSDLYLPILKEKDKGVVAGGIAIFSNEKLVKKLDENQTMAFVIIKNRCKGGLISVKDEKLGIVGLEIANCKTKNRAKRYKKRLVFQTEVKLELNLSDTENGVATRVTEEDINRLEVLVNSKIKNTCTDLVKTSFENNSDVFFFDKMVAKAYPKYYKAHQNYWRDELRFVDYEISVDSKLKSIDNSSKKG